MIVPLAAPNAAAGCSHKQTGWAAPAGHSEIDEAVLLTWNLLRRNTCLCRQSTRNRNVGKTQWALYQSSQDSARVAQGLLPASGYESVGDEPMALMKGMSTSSRVKLACCRLAPCAGDTLETMHD